MASVMEDRRWRNCFCAIAMAIVAVALTCASASAATLHVELSGTDNGTCGPVLTPCRNVSQAVTNSLTNDTIEIGSGNFTMANAILIGNKSLTITGQGPTQTTLDGQNSTTFTTSGTFRYNIGGTTQTVSNLGFVNTGRPGASGRAYALLAQPTGVAVQSVNLTVTNVAFTGGQPNETPIASNNNGGTLQINNFTTTDVNGNSLLLGRHVGPVTVQNSNLQTNPAAGDYPIYGYSWGGATWNVTGHQTYSNNTLVGRGGIRLTAGFEFDASLAVSPYLGGVTISDNLVSSNGSASLAISLANTANNAAGTGGEIVNAVITGNILDGSGAGSGITLSGAIDGASIDHNSVRDYVTGVQLVRRSTTYPHAPDGTAINFNQIVGNGLPSATNGLEVVAQASNTDATDNWWGCNQGPPVVNSPPASGCDAIVIESGAAVSIPSWIILTLSVNPAASLAADASAALTATLNTNNLGATVNGVFADGTVLPMSSTGGTLTTTNPTLTGGVTSNSFQSTAGSGRSASATMDNATVTVVWPDIDQPQPPIPPTPTPIDPLPECARDLAITNVAQRGSRSLIQGVARLRFAGQRVSINYRPTGRRVVGRALVGADGRFSITVRRPSRPAASSNNARYRGLLGGQATSWVKLTRRLTTTIFSYANGRVTVQGRIIKPIAPGQRISVNRSDQCGRYRRIGTVRVNRNGTFKSSAPAVPNPAAPVPFIRLVVRVRRGGNGPRRNGLITTFSIVQPVLIR